MVQLPQRFNVADVPEDEYEVIPPGNYVAMITESDMKPTKDGEGAYVELKIQLDGGRVLFERLNIQNKNEKAVEIAYKTLAKICNACNKTSIQKTEELHNIRFKVDVEVEKGKPYFKDGVQKDGNDQNRIKKYYSINEASAAPASGKAPASADDAALPPWKRAK